MVSLSIALRAQAFWPYQISLWSLDSLDLSMEAYRNYASAKPQKLPYCDH
jgi:hypothetical protein